MTVATIVLSIFSNSCTSLKPITANSSLQTIGPSEISKFNGNYEIISLDSSFRTLEYALTFSGQFDFLDLPKNNDRVNMAIIDSRHLKISVYKSDTLIVSRIIKGRIFQNYFHSNLTSIAFVKPFYGILNIYRRQKVRLGLLQSGDLILDCDTGGVLLLVAFPIFGSSDEQYNLVFKRRADSY
jgi:hypothetical protein